MTTYESWKVKYQSKQGSAYGKVDRAEATQIAHDQAEDAYRDAGGDGAMDEWEHYELALSDIHATINALQCSDAIISFTLNEKGQKDLLAAIQAVSNHKLTNPDAYFADAEESADRWNSGENPIIEIEAKYTQSGNPEIIRLEKEWFDVEVVE